MIFKAEAMFVAVSFAKTRNAQLPAVTLKRHVRQAENSVSSCLFMLNACMKDTLGNFCAVEGVQYCGGVPSSTVEDVLYCEGTASVQLRNSISFVKEIEYCAALPSVVWRVLYTMGGGARIIPIL